MNTERWKQVDSLLQSVLERVPEDRRAFLLQACAGDELLEREVRSLLTFEHHAAGFPGGPCDPGRGGRTRSCGEPELSRKRRLLDRP